MPTITFFSLPRELRDIIYSHALPPKLYLSSKSDLSLPSNRKLPWIYFVNKQFHTEAISALHRSLATTSIRVEPDTLRYTLQSNMSWLGTHIRHLTITLHCYRSGSESNFALDCPSLRYETQRDLARSIDRITGLREFKFEVTWHPNNSTAVLLPAQREVMLGQIRDVAIGDRGAWEGWLDECKVRDATRWKVRWSGVVWMRRRDGLDAMG